MPKAYTYLIVRKADRKRYIGFRYANVARGIPARQDLGRTYFTSSKVVQPEFERDPSAFMFRVLQEFDSKDEAADAESELFAKYGTTSDDQYLNKCDWLHGKFLLDRSKPVLAWKDGEIVGFYESATKAAWELGGSRPFGICDAAAGRVKSSLGFQWTYLDQDEESRLNSESIDTLPLEDAAGEVDPGPEEARIVEEWLDSRRRALVRAKAAMTDKQRDAFELIREQGMTWVEARPLLKVTSDKAIADRLAGADKKIKAALAAVEE